MVDTAEQAKALVEAMRYPPHGIRGMGGARASRWGRYPQYAQEANQQVCLLVQAETTTALQNLDAIAAVEGVDDGVLYPRPVCHARLHVRPGNEARGDIVLPPSRWAARAPEAAGRKGVALPPQER
jgi:4-hydroxy-2-oxoheptanedioate aldolase